MDRALEDVENALQDAVARAGQLSRVIRGERQKLARLLQRSPLPEQPSEAQSELDLSGEPET